MRPQSQTMSTLGLSPPIRVLDILPSPPTYTGDLLPGILVNFSTGASLTCNVEVTGTPSPVNAVGEPWNIADSGGSLTANTNLTLAAAVVAMRLNVTSYTSGSVTLTLIQP